jgi:hypothetical protein
MINRRYRDTKNLPLEDFRFFIEENKNTFCWLLRGNRIMNCESIIGREKVFNAFCSEQTITVPSTMIFDNSK